MSIPNDKVSVVIPSYNRSGVIGRAVKSALEQTHSNLEILVVDDGSADVDELAEVLQAFADERVSLVHQEQNQGGGAARNRGVKEATGDYIAFLDSDDAWQPSKLEAQLKAFGGKVEQKKLLYCVSEVRTTLNGELRLSNLPAKAIKEGERVGDYLFIGSGYLPTPSIFLPRWLALEVLFNEDLPRHQDYDLLLRLEAYGCQFEMCEKSLVIVHWEDFETQNRGGNIERSVSFLRNYRQYMSVRAQSAFAATQIVIRLLCQGDRGRSLVLLVKFVRPWRLPVLVNVNLLSQFLFGDNRISLAIAKLKSKLVTR